MDTTTREQFGAAVRRERLERDWSQDEAARQLGVTVSALSKLEQHPERRPSTKTAIKAAVLFGWTVSDLVAFGVLGPFRILSAAA